MVETRRSAASSASSMDVFLALSYVEYDEHVALAAIDHLVAPGRRLALDQRHVGTHDA